jgi:hypothetical protein
MYGRACACKAVGEEDMEGKGMMRKERVWAGGVECTRQGGRETMVWKT